MDSALGPNRRAKYSAPRPNAPASKVAKPRFIPLHKVAPILCKQQHLEIMEGKMKGN